MKEKIKRTHFANELKENILGQKVNVGGWIEDIRDIGKIIFLTIKDITGSIQVIVESRGVSTNKRNTETKLYHSFWQDTKKQSKRNDSRVKIRRDCRHLSF